MNRFELQEQIREILNSAGFYVSELHSIRLTGFDIVARRDETLLIIKVMSNIDSISENVANELKTLSTLLKGCPLLIGEKNGSNVLEDDVVYFRFGIQAITINTLRNTLLEGIPVEVYAGPGGLYVNLDETKLREIREDKGISLGALARSINVSRRTVRMYEEGMNSRVEVAQKIEKLLEQRVSVPINILKNPKLNEKFSFSYRGELDHIESFKKEVFSLLKNVGYKIIPMEKCPFEALSKDSEKILLTCVHKYNNKLIKKAEIVGSISKIMEKHAVVVTDKDISKRNVRGTPIIIKKELKRLSDPEEVFELIIERI
jgi:putative transcriptional regulator